MDKNLARDISLHEVWQANPKANAWHNAIEACDKILKTGWRRCRSLVRSPASIRVSVPTVFDRSGVLGRESAVLAYIDTHQAQKALIQRSLKRMPTTSRVPTAPMPRTSAKAGSIQTQIRAHSTQERSTEEMDRGSSGHCCRTSSR